ncbi:MAG: hypothetical protein MK108_01350 [Mariniblastus sp.]|nr:hypothetical protein [Mariniblastus sp.]
MLKYLFLKPSDDSPSGPWLEVPPEADVFTYHREHAGRALLFGLILAAIIEATALHWLISLWSHWLALAATVTTVWLILQILAQIRAVGLRPIYINQGHLILRNGAFDLADVPVSQIESIEKSSREPNCEKGDLAPLNVSFPASHNIIMRLKEPAEATLLNRKKRDFQIALLAIDEGERLVETVDNQLAEIRETEARMD